MVAKPAAALPAPADLFDQFPELPPRDDMRNSLFLNEPAPVSALRMRLGFSASTLVISETPGWNRGYSATLGLYLCWEYGCLRWYDPETGYLPTHYETSDERDAERAARIAAEAERDAERAARLRLEAEISRLRRRQPPVS